MTVSRWRVLVAPFVVLVAALLAGPGAARADAPLRLEMQVIDRADAVDNRAPIDDALAELQRETGIQLWVVFVESFDAVPAQQWTDETAQLSDLGDRDALLAVATVDRSYAYSFPDDSRLSDSELAEVAENDIEPALAKGDWSGAVVAGAAGFQEAAGGSGGLIWAVLFIGLILVGALVWVMLRRRRKPAPVPEVAAGPSLEELSTRANALLIELDDNLRASEREGSLASAQYGVTVTKPFDEALAFARGNVAEAFRLRMTLEEEPAPDAAARRGTLLRIIELCEAADARLDAESEAFDQLRDLEGRAAEVAGELERQRVAIEAGLAEAGAAVTELAERYSGDSVTGVAGNVGQARERLAFAADALGRARAALAGSAASDSSAQAEAGPAEAGQAGSGPAEAARAGAGRAEAALAVRAAEQAIDQAEQLVTAVGKAVADLPAARAAADALITEITGEIAAGRAAMAGARAGTDAGGLGAAVAGGELALAEARQALGAARPDPVAVVARLQAADAALDVALAAAVDQAERDARARAVLAQTLPLARAEIAAANDFIGTRRGAVGPDARVRLSEALRHLALAEQLAATDAHAAAQEVAQARQLAAAAGHAAQADVNSWSSGGYGRGGGVDAGQIAGAVLGGILSGAMRGGGGGHGGFGHGGFGGSGSRARRTGGGGGGGRRGGGGRF
ncbi:TPM domain-containing protein [Actinoplanes sp. CA-015351]|uniref:TPM domain-containing protein n=1 Tax=Actinoplanes sp. CA-015351 TaxID=3239897 RepID=UPI003D950B7C